MNAYQLELTLLAERDRIREIQHLQREIVLTRELKRTHTRRWFPTFLHRLIGRRQRAVAANQTV